jgi:hypothetical protein
MKHTAVQAIRLKFGRVMMTQEYSQEELSEAYFIQLVYTFQAAAMQQMGKLMSPLTGKVEKNMEQAKHSIDMLAMLESKTSGNLNEKEKKLLEQVLFELRMNYVDEMKVTGEEGEEQQAEVEAQKKEEKQETGTVGETGGTAKAGAEVEKKESPPPGKKGQTEKGKRKKK